MRERLRSIFDEVLGGVTSGAHSPHLDLGDHSRFQDLGIDSLDLVEFFVRVEEDFGVQIPEEDFGRLRSLDDVLAFLEENRAVDLGRDDAAELAAGGNGRA